MHCSQPIYLKNQQYLVPCGKCYACRSTYRDNWVYRLKNHLSVVKKGIFLTLSYNDISLPRDMSVSVKDVQLFMKRLRKHYPSGTISYFVASEYGDKNLRPHYHILLFGIECPTSNYMRIKLSNHIAKNIWKKGYCFVGDLNEKTIKYTTKYILKDTMQNKDKQYYEDYGITKPFTLKSTKLGLEYFHQHISTFIEKCFDDKKNNYIPRYYRNKLIEYGFIEDDFFLKKYYKQCAEFKNKCLNFIKKNSPLKLHYYKNYLFSDVGLLYENQDPDFVDNDHWYSIYRKLYAGYCANRQKILTNTWKYSTFE